MDQKRDDRTPPINKGQREWVDNNINEHIQGYTDILLHGYIDTRTYCYTDTLIHGHTDTWTH